MINPCSLVRALDKHWDAIEQLVAHGRDTIAFERDDLMMLLAKVYVNETSEQQIERLQNMVNSELLTELARSNSFQLNDNVSQFVGNLLHEHELGLSEVLKARITDIKTGLDQLHQAMQSSDMAAMQRGAVRIDNQLRQIMQQLDQDSHAIADIAERAKATDNAMPLERRYREVLDAYDRYVLPMTELMDTGAGGSFYPLLEEAERTLESLVQQLMTQGGLYSHQLLLRQVSFRIKDLRQLGREVLKQCTNTLMPLREEIRQHNHLSSAISLLLGEVRKKGMRKTFPKASLPLWRKEKTVLISVGPELLTMMEQARDYQPSAIAFPEHSSEENEVNLERVNEEEILHRLYTDLPISSLMQWLTLHFGDYQDSTLLKLYHKLIRLPDIVAEPNKTETRIALKHVAVRLHSHTMDIPHD